MRKHINGLSVIVESSMMLDPFASALFVFTNKTTDKVKILYWCKNGFCLWMKRLEKDKFVWPSDFHNLNITLEHRELELLLEGYDISRLRPHRERKYTKIS